MIDSVEAYRSTLRFGLVGLLPLKAFDGLDGRRAGRLERPRFFVMSRTLGLGSSQRTVATVGT
jgi:hypothetical protein